MVFRAMCWDEGSAEGPGLSCWAVWPDWVFNQKEEPEQCRDRAGQSLLETEASSWLYIKIQPLQGVFAVSTASPRHHTWRGEKAL